MSVNEVSTPAAEQCSQEADDSHYDHSVRDDRTSRDAQTTRTVRREGAFCKGGECVCKFIREDEEDNIQRGEEPQEGGGYDYCSDSVPIREKVGCQSGQNDEGNSNPGEGVSDYSNYGHLDQYGHYIPRGPYAVHKPIQYQRCYPGMCYPVTGQPRRGEEINYVNSSIMRNRPHLRNGL